MLNEYLNYLQNRDTKTINAYRYDVKQLLDYCSQQNKSVSNVTPEFIEEFLNQCCSEYRLSTKRRKVTSLNNFYKWLVKTGRANNNPIKVRVPRSKPNPITYITKNEKTKLFQTIMNSPGDTFLKLRDSLLFHMMFVTGLKANQLLNLSMEDVNLLNTCIYVKNKPYYITSLENILAVYINYRYERIKDKSHQNMFFINNRGGKLSERSVRRKLCQYAKMSGINHLNPTKLRDSVAVDAVINGNNRQFEDMGICLVKQEVILDVAKNIFTPLPNHDLAPEENNSIIENNLVG